MPPVRIASVPYINAAPLVWGFRNAAPGDAFALMTAPPAAIPDLLLTGRADVGLIPAIEYARLPGAVLLPGLGVAAKRKARSVYLASTRPLQAIRSVALDPASRASAALLRVVLSHRGITAVSYAEQAPVLGEMLRSHDAALLIGDAALQADTRGLEVYDLAEEWHRMTGLPFVFALWAVRPGVVLPDGASPFVDSCREGRAHIDQIAREAAGPTGLDSSFLADYLKTNIHHEIDRDDLRGLELFLAMAFGLGLIEGPPDLRFLTAAPAGREPGAAAIQGPAPVPGPRPGSKGEVRA